MAKKRKKKTGIKQHKKLIQDQRIEFFKLLSRIAEASDATNEFSSLPQKEYDYIWLARITAFRVEKEDGAPFSKKVIQTFKEMTVAYMKHVMLTFKEGKPQISVYEYYKAGLSLRFYLRNLNDEKFPESPQLKKAFKPFMDVVDIADKPRSIMINLSIYFSWLISDVEKGYIHFVYDSVIQDYGENYDRFLLKASDAEIHFIEINGNTRPVFKMFYMEKDGSLYEHRVKASEINTKGAFGDLHINIFIQAHAIIRLKERLKGFGYEVLRKELNLSLLNPDKKIIHYKGKILIEYLLSGYKVGWLMADVTEGKLVIQTFLFLTNDGCPEGQNLKESVGLQAEGKRYFKIDTLAAFLNSDIEHNATLKSIFIKAGCGDLFKVKELIKTDNNKTKVADDLLKYLNMI